MVAEAVRFTAESAALQLWRDFHQREATCSFSEVNRLSRHCGKGSPAIDLAAC
ncbi:hypothetical protein ACNJYD_08415 [Bradyrhizobium sp. DASA03005]|uniref:hypothetical protein n=1 Tax=Bradyrhizobium sp. SPXBL-02 TaxID=3395912 RepID=UPI003F6EEDF9